MMSNWKISSRSVGLSRRRKGKGSFKLWRSKKKNWIRKDKESCQLAESDSLPYVIHSLIQVTRRELRSITKGSLSPKKAIIRRLNKKIYRQEFLDLLRTLPSSNSSKRKGASITSFPHGQEPVSLAPDRTRMSKWISRTSTTETLERNRSRN